MKVCFIHRAQTMALDNKKEGRISLSSFATSIQRLTTILNHY